MAPEILNESSYNKSVDLWAIGIMLYELLFGANPYNMQSSDLSPQEYKEIIEESDLIFPDRDLYDIEYSDQAQDLITTLLNINPIKRTSCEALKSHIWFKDANWDEVINQTIDAPIKPEIHNDLRNPKKIYEELNPPEISKKSLIVSQTHDKDFQKEEFNTM